MQDVNQFIKVTIASELPALICEASWNRLVAESRHPVEEYMVKAITFLDVTDDDGDISGTFFRNAFGALAVRLGVDVIDTWLDQELPWMHLSILIYSLAEESTNWSNGWDDEDSEIVSLLTMLVMASLETLAGAAVEAGVLTLQSDVENTEEDGAFLEFFRLGSTLLLDQLISDKPHILERVKNNLAAVVEQTWGTNPDVVDEAAE